MAKIKPAIPSTKPERSKRAANPARPRSAGATSANRVDAAKPAKAPRAPSAAKAKMKPKAASIKMESGRFSMPATEFRQIAALKGRALGLGRPAKKNELLRIGLLLVAALADESLVLALDQLAPIKSKKPKAAKPAKRGDI